MDLRRMLGSQDNIRIMAYAGIGKTSTLVEMCRRHPAIRFLLVVFNKSLQLHSKVFPPNVTVMTEKFCFMLHHHVSFLYQ